MLADVNPLFVTVVVVVVVGMVVLVIAASVWAMEQPSVLTIGAAGLAVAGVALAVALVYNRWGTSDGVHRWDGGAGPATVCYFAVDDQLRPVGKVLVPVEQMQTVCRDPE